MNLSRCSNGHFYDKEKYATCPHCAQGAKKNDGDMTVVFDENEGGDMGETMPLDTPTEPLTPPTPIPAPAPAPAPSPIPAGTPSPVPNLVFPNPPGVSPIPNIGGGVGDGTEMINGDRSGLGAVHITNIPETESYSPDDDDDGDHTIGFFDLLDEEPSQPTTPSSIGVTATAVPPVIKEPAKKQAHHVSSPCTGWLVALNGAHIGEDFRLKAGKNFVGRSADMDVALSNDKSVSRNKHAIVVYEPKQHLYLIQPGESSELVYLNDDVVLSPMKLSAYDMITVGEVNLLFMPLCGDRFNWPDTIKKNKG